MADKEAKWTMNKDGKFYVDDQCIACDACVVEAPTYFAMNDEDGHAYVTAQPESTEALEECDNALACCPVGAIGDDGQE